MELESKTIEKGLDTINKVIETKYSLLRFIILLIVLVITAIILFNIKDLKKILGESEIYHELSLSNGEVKKLVDNLTIEADVITLDSLTFTTDDLKKVKTIAGELGVNLNQSPFLENYERMEKGSGIFKDYDTKKFPNNITFQRFHKIFESSELTHNFDFNQRREILVSKEYWQLLQKGLDINVFPKLKQYSIIVIKITGLNENCNGYVIEQLDKANEDFSLAVNNLTSEQRIPAAYNNGQLLACLVEKEKLIFNTEKASFEIQIDKICNVIKARGDNDTAILKWSIKSL